MAEHAIQTRSSLSDFDRLLTHLATDFINVPTDRIEAAVEDALRRFGEFAHLHRCSIALLDEGRTVFEHTYEWCAPGVTPGAINYRGAPLARFPWVREQVLADEIMLIGSAEDLPSAPERIGYMRHGVGSTLIVPMKAAAGPIGCLTFAVDDLKKWTEDDISLLRVAAAMFVNVFERKRTEELAARYARELERSNADLEEFAYHASHDLQEPLRMVTGYCELLARRCAGLDAEARELISRAIDGARRMKDLVSALLRYSSVGKKGQASSITDCSALLEVTLSNLEAFIEERGAEVTVDNLPTVAGDSVQLGQVFQNLISNAVKFSDAKPRIHVGVQERPGEYLFFVRDNGIGIPADGREHLFEAFHRLHARSDLPGTGIGLAICKKIVERSGGRIWAESLPGQGSTFYFALPRADNELREDRGAMSAANGRVPAGRVGRSH